MVKCNLSFFGSVAAIISIWAFCSLENFGSAPGAFPRFKIFNPCWLNALMALRTLRASQPVLSAISLVMYLWNCCLWYGSTISCLFYYYAISRYGLIFSGFSFENTLRKFNAQLFSLFIIIVR